MPRQVDLTGWWYADRDNALYYIRQLNDNSIWWTGVRAWWGFYPGLEFTNVFHGVVNPDSMTIDGHWADVPRGSSLNDGQLSLDIVQITEQERFVRSPDKPLIPRDGPPHDGRPPRSRFELRQKPQGTTGGFGNIVWQKTDPIGPVGADFVEFLFGQVKRDGGGNPLLDEIKPFKDYAVIWGHIGAMGPAYRIGWGPLQPLDYCRFIEGADEGDGDITFNLDLDAQDRRDLDSQPDFWVQSSGWLRPAAQILARLNLTSSFHSEMIMFGREEDEDHCADSHGGLLPGWAETSGNSVLINGLPINGNAFTSSEGIIYFVLFSPEVPGNQIQVLLRPQSKVRVTGVISLDMGHSEDDHPTRQLEIHPLYSIDLQQNFGQRRPGADLTGVWHANDTGTYYVRQVDGNAVWWLGLSRDQGRTFANVFHGALDQGNTVRGEWSDIPVSAGGARSSGRLTLIGDGSGQLTTTLTAVDRTGGFGGSLWRKLYDRPFFFTTLP